MFIFEIHLTTRTQDLSTFTQICTSLGAKAVAIVLPYGEHIHQPMLSMIQPASNLSETLQICHQFSTTLAQYNLPTLRTKIEIPADDVHRYLTTHNQGCYFEWHGKIYYDNLEALKDFAQCHQAHLSNNELQSQPNLRFLTIRHDDKHNFDCHVHQIKLALANSSFILKKSHNEYCVYDDKVILDKGWIN